MGTELTDSHVCLLPPILSSFRQFGWSVPDLFAKRAFLLLKKNAKSLSFG